MRTSAIFVDFDNVFGGLHALDPAAAKQIAQNPDRWMLRLAEGTAEGAGEPAASRRWVIRRCYINPAGWVWENGERLYLSRFRPFFVRAGFEVVDCPPLTKNGKNAADIRICLDVMDLLGSRRQPDELVIASSDSDFTPLLHRVRSEGCLTALITTGDAVSAYKALADEILDAPTFLELLAEEPDAVDAEMPSLLEEPAVELTDEEQAEARGRFESFARRQYEAATAPLNLARFSVQARRELGADVAATGWFGAGTFTGALRQVGLSGMTLDQHHVWDEGRHEAPANGDAKDTLPDTIAQVTAVTDLPGLDREIWPHVYAALAEYAATHDFNLTESTKWTRDRLAEQGHAIGRNVVSYTLQAASLGGARLRRDPPTTADEIGAAFFGAVRHRAKSAGLVLDDEQAEELRAWLGAPDPGPAVTDVVGNEVGAAVHT